MLTAIHSIPYLEITQFIVTKLANQLFERDKENFGGIVYIYIKKKTTVWAHEEKKSIQSLKYLWFVTDLEMHWKCVDLTLK